MRLIVVSLIAVGLAFGQTSTAPTGGVVVNFPTVPLPIAVAAFGQFNQLGSPAFTGGFAALYPVSGSVGIYGATVTTFLPTKATDPTTGKTFYAVGTSVDQEFHKSLFQLGNATFLVGAGVGPTISQSSTALVTGGNATYVVSFTTEVIATVLYQITPAFSVIAPVKATYISPIGWNVQPGIGVAINLKQLKVKPPASSGTAPTAKQMRLVLHRLHIQPLRGGR
jgi:hypothetical protein